MEKPTAVSSFTDDRLLLCAAAALLVLRSSPFASPNVVVDSRPRPNDGLVYRIGDSSMNHFTLAVCSLATVGVGKLFIKQPLPSANGKEK